MVVANRNSHRHLRDLRVPLPQPSPIMARGEAPPPPGRDSVCRLWGADAVRRALGPHPRGPPCNRSRCGPRALGRLARWRGTRGLHHTPHRDWDPRFLRQDSMGPVPRVGFRPPSWVLGRTFGDFPGPGSPVLASCATRMAGGAPAAPALASRGNRSWLAPCECSPAPRTRHTIAFVAAVAVYPIGEAADEIPLSLLGQALAK